jgi:hypothetical protein
MYLHFYFTIRFLSPLIFFFLPSFLPFLLALLHFSFYFSHIITRFYFYFPAYHHIYPSILLPLLRHILNLLLSLQTIPLPPARSLSPPLLFQGYNPVRTSCIPGAFINS